MPNLNIKNLSKDLHRRLKERAQRNRRSLNSEVISCLQDVLLPKRLDPDEAAERVRLLRNRFRGSAPSDAEIAQLKSEGRQ